MTIQSDKELQEFIDSKLGFNYRDEEVQKRTIIFGNMGAEITLYDWIHRYDNPPTIIMNLDGMSAEGVEEFRKEFRAKLDWIND